MKFERFLKLLEIPDSTKRLTNILNSSILIMLTLVIFNSKGVILTKNMQYTFYMWTIIAVLWPSIDFFSNNMQLYLNRKDHHNKKEE